MPTGIAAQRGASRRRDHAASASEIVNPGSPVIGGTIENVVPAILHPLLDIAMQVLQSECIRLFFTNWVGLSTRILLTFPALEKGCRWSWLPRSSWNHFLRPRLSGSGFKVLGWKIPNQLISNGFCLHRVYKAVSPNGYVGIPNLDQYDKQYLSVVTSCMKLHFLTTYCQIKSNNG